MPTTLSLDGDLATAARKRAERGAASVHQNSLDEPGHSNATDRRVIPKPSPLYVDGSGRVTQGMPSQSRSLMTVAQPKSTLPAAVRSPAINTGYSGSADFYANAQGDVGKSPPSSSRGVMSAAQAAEPLMGGAPPQAEPNNTHYRQRAEAKARVMRDTANFEAERAKQDARFAEAAQEQNRTQANAPSRSKVATAGRALGGVGTAYSTYLEAKDVAAVANDPNSTAADVAAQGAEGVGKLASAGAGAALGAKGGAALGLMTGPFAPIASPVLGLVGGIGGGVVGYVGADKIIRAGRGLFGGDSSSPVERTGSAQEIGPATELIPASQVTQAQAPQAQAAHDPRQWTAGDGTAMRLGAGESPEFSNEAKDLEGAQAMPDGGFGGAPLRQPGVSNLADDVPLSQRGSIKNMGNGIGGGLSVGQAGDAANAIAQFDQANAIRREQLPGVRVRGTGYQAPKTRREMIQERHKASLDQGIAGISLRAREAEAREQQAAIASQQVRQQMSIAGLDLASRERIDSLASAMADVSLAPEQRQAAQEAYAALTTKPRDRYILQDEQMGVDAFGVPKYGKVAYDVTTRQRLGDQNASQQPSFKEGKVYKNAKGERARYSGTDASGNPIWEQV